MDSETQRAINRRVAERYAPELIEFFATCKEVGFTPKFTQLSFSGEALAYYNELCSTYQQTAHSMQPASQ